MIGALFVCVCQTWQLCGGTVESWVVLMGAETCVEARWSLEHGGGEKYL